MNISFVDKTTSQKQIEVNISVEEMQPYVLQAAKNLGARVHMQGFRPGKVPADLVRSTLGEGTIWEEAAKGALQETLEDTCKEYALDLLGIPTVEVLQLAPGNDFRYRATVEVVPPVALCDVRAVAKQVYEKEHRDDGVQVQEKEVEDTLDWLVKSRAAYHDVSRGAKKGDVVEVSYEGKIGKVVQQGFEQTTRAFTVGENTVHEVVFSAIEAAVVGMQKGEEKNIVVLLPNAYPDLRLAGKSIEIRLMIKNIKERTVPALDDAFAHSIGDFQTLHDLKKSVQQGLRLEKEKNEDERVTLLQIKEIARQSHVETPEILTDQELERMKEEFSRELMSIGTTLPAYLEQIKKTEEDVKNGWKEKAEERVRAGLVLRAIAKQENIAADEQEVERRVNTLLARYKNEKEAYEYEGSPEALRARIKGAIRNEKVLELLKGI